MEQSISRSSHRPALRAGGRALTLLVGPLNIEILRRLEPGPRSTQSLRRELGVPPQSTLRLHLRALAELGAVDNHPHDGQPTSADHEISRAGRGLLHLAEHVEAWLRVAPGGPKELGSTGARSSIKALVDGWSSHIVRALAARPLSLTELNSLIPRISYPSLERRLTAMRECGLVEVQPDAGRLRPYKVTRWLRQGVGPVTAAMAWERTYAPAQTARVRRLDAESAFLLAIPLLDLPTGLNGRCRLAVEVHDGTSPLFAGALVTIERGTVTSCVASLEGQAEAWASGRPLSWLRLIDRPGDGELELGGDRVLARSVVEALQRAAREPN
ncbi:MAG TPA: helix-turn-helix domain-containing protein [Solirubrobacterales bacterium]|nr:helix-turn-helix domain-containing protein [Solirubrobacterales bacterium]